MKFSKILMVAFLAIFITACGNKGAESIGTKGSLFGIIIKKRPVIIKGNGEAGSLIGEIAGSSIAENNSSNDGVSLIGSIAGGLLGGLAGEEATKSKGMEYTIKTVNPHPTKVITKQLGFEINDRVIVSFDDKKVTIKKLVR